MANELPVATEAGCMRQPDGYRDTCCSTTYRRSVLQSVPTKDRSAAVVKFLDRRRWLLDCLRHERRQLCR